MKIAIFGRNATRINKEFFGILTKAVEKVGGSLIIYKDFSAELLQAGLELSHLPTFTNSEDLKGQANWLFSIGGDGTLLNTIPVIKDANIPVLGINTGRLGFLSSIQTEEIDEALRRLVNDDYVLDKRTLLQLNSKEGLFNSENFALNEMTVIKKDTSTLISIEVHLNEKYLNTYWADGLIISTPTGSTAYSLSCGGPIVVPGSGNFTITPIAPHNLNVRPIVIPDHYNIGLKLFGRASSHLVSLDSRSATTTKRQELEIVKAGFNINLIRMEEYSFFHTLRNKLSWGLDKRN